MGVIHGKFNKPQPPAQAVDSSNSVRAESTTPAQSPVMGQPEVKPAETNIIATTTDEDRAAQKEKDLDALSDALVTGINDPGAVYAIASRLENVDQEVRTAAREAAVHLGDTNIIPYLNTAVEHLKDAREKVAILDAIAYLQMPSDTMTNGAEAQLLDVNALGAKPARQVKPR
jgi:hypothetical protein